MGTTNGNLLSKLVQDIVGHVCEVAENPYGSVLSLDFGPMGRRANDAPDAKLHGWRNLVILSPWRLEDDVSVRADWNVEGGSEGELQEILKALTGHKVVSASTSGPAWDLRLEWSHGLRMVVFADSTDDRDDAWFILGTDGAEASAVPIWSA